MSTTLAVQHISEALNNLPEVERNEVISRLHDIATTGSCEDYSGLWLSTQAVFLLSVAIMEMMGLDDWQTRPIAQSKHRENPDLAAFFHPIFR